MKIHGIREIVNPTPPDLSSKTKVQGILNAARPDPNAPIIYDDLQELHQQLQVMSGLQKETNITVNPDWFNQNWDWDAAIIVEVGELFDKLGYKWWKKQVIDIPGAQMEIVDILHFTISLGLQRGGLVEDLHTTQYKSAGINIEECTIALHQFIEELTRTTSGGGNLFNHLYHAASYLGLSSDDLFYRYIGKNALNNLRQAYGYKDGTYIKNWEGREDNEVLEEVLINTASSKVPADKLYTLVYTAMECRYLTIQGNF